MEYIVSAIINAPHIKKVWSILRDGSWESHFCRRNLTLHYAPSTLNINKWILYIFIHEVHMHIHVPPYWKSLTLHYASSAKHFSSFQIIIETWITCDTCFFITWSSWIRLGDLVSECTWMCLSHSPLYGWPHRKKLCRFLIIFCILLIEYFLYWRNR